MVITSINSGLGNQLFQYAMGRSLATRRAVPLKLDLEWFHRQPDLPGLNMFARRCRLHEFNLQPADVATPAEIARYQIRPLSRRDPRRLRGPWWRFLRRYFPERCHGLQIIDFARGFEPALLRLPGDVLLTGWWQNENYFADIADTLRREFTPRDPAVTARAAAIIREHRHDDRPVVGVQVRRGDVARAHEVLKDVTNMPYELVSRDYLQAALAEFGDAATFLVFSESPADLDWCRANLSARDIHFVRGESDLHDFETLRLCDHQIISNSSFGWWAAWLNPNPAKTVVAPRRWYRPAHAPGHDIHTLIPSAWIIK